MSPIPGVGAQRPQERGAGDKTADPDGPPQQQLHPVVRRPRHHGRGGDRGENKHVDRVLHGPECGRHATLRAPLPESHCRKQSHRHHHRQVEGHDRVRVHPQRVDHGEDLAGGYELRRRGDVKAAQRDGHPYDAADPPGREGGLESPHAPSIATTGSGVATESVTSHCRTSSTRRASRRRLTWLITLSPTAVSPSTAKRRIIHMGRFSVPPKRADGSPVGPGSRTSPSVDRKKASGPHWLPGYNGQSRGPADGPRPNNPRPNKMWGHGGSGCRAILYRPDCTVHRPVTHDGPLSCPLPEV